jgi:translocator protein
VRGRQVGLANRSYQSPRSEQRPREGREEADGDETQEHKHTNWLFAPVWTVLYFTIAISGWLVWREAGFAGAALPLAIYALQLVLNAAWTPIFFGLHRPDLRFLDIVLVWVSIIATIARFFPIHAAAALLLLPYLAWVTFAAALNFAVWRLNR